MNNFNGIGRITATPEIRYASSNVEVCSFTIAINRKFKNQDGDYETDFINCVAFRNTAKLIGSYVEKGDKLGITGRIQTRSYENSEGKRVYITEVVVEQIDFFEPKKKEESVTSTKTQEDPFAGFGDEVIITDDDLPF